MRCLFLHGSAETAARLGPLLEEFTHAHVHPGGAWDLLIRWGNRSGGDAEQTVNRLAALDNPADHPQVHRQLALNRLPCRRTRPKRTRRMGGARRRGRRPLSGARLRSAAGGHREHGRFARRRPARRRGMYYLARRAVYALGLHFGAVDIAVTPRNRLVILNVEPAPPLSPALARRYARAVKNTSSGCGRPLKFRLRCGPPPSCWGPTPSSCSGGAPPAGCASPPISSPATGWWHMTSRGSAGATASAIR